MRDMIIVNFNLDYRNEKVLSAAPERTAGILRFMREYLESGACDGNVPLAG